MKEILQKIFTLLDLRITKDFRIYKLFHKNVFKSDSKKKVLISYVTKPFGIGIDYSHTNLRVCYAVAEIFHGLGYCVDVVEYSLRKNINYSQYDIIFGMGNVLEESFYIQENPSPFRIFYATGCNPVYSNVATTLKVRDFYQKHKTLLVKSSRILQQSQHAQILLSDAVIVLGDEFVLHTFASYDPGGVERYSRLNSFFNDVYDINLESKDFSKAKKNFLWFGSGGLLHKGLDILLDIFSKRDDIFLHICGASKHEKDFFNFYKNLLSNSPNIVNHGFVKMESEAFKTIMDTCGFVVLPSVSEGGSPAILNTVANGGLVPIITKSSGLDMDSFGWVIDKPDINLFTDAINQALSLSNDEFKEKSHRIKTHVRRNYTYEIYKQNIENIIRKILKNSKNSE